MIQFLSLPMLKGALAYQQSSQANDYAMRDWERRLQYQKDVYAAQDRAGVANMRQVRSQAAQQRQATFERAHQLRSHLRAAAGESIGYGGTYQAVARQGAIDAARAFGTLKANEVGAIQSVRSRIRQPLDVGSPPQLTNPGMDAFMTTLNEYLKGIGSLVGMGDAMSLDMGSGPSMASQPVNAGFSAGGSAGTGAVGGSVSGGIGGGF